MDLLDSLEFLNSLEFQDMVWFGIDWYGFVWFHMVLFGMVLFGFVLFWGLGGMFENVLEFSRMFWKTPKSFMVGGWVVCCNYSVYSGPDLLNLR